MQAEPKHPNSEIITNLSNHPSEFTLPSSPEQTSYWSHSALVFLLDKQANLQIRVEQKWILSCESRDQTEADNAVIRNMKQRRKWCDHRISKQDHTLDQTSVPSFFRELEGFRCYGHTTQRKKSETWYLISSPVCQSCGFQSKWMGDGAYICCSGIGASETILQPGSLEPPTPPTLDRLWANPWNAICCCFLCCRFIGSQWYRDAFDWSVI